MKRVFFIISLITSVNILNAQNVSVTDYEVPISQAKSLRFDGSYNWVQTGNSVTANNATASLLFRTFYSSLPLAWFIDVDAIGGKSFGDYTHNILLEASFRKYIWNNRDWFGFNRLNAQHAEFYKQIAADLTVGFGYGRYINATALAKAVRIEDHLLRDGVITDHLPKEIMINIANIIERQEEYRDTYGTTYETQWFADIEKEIQKTEELEDVNVGSIGILRMRQVLFGINERVNDRFYGWDLTMGVLFPLTTFDKSPAGNPNLTVSGRYSFPISWQLQVNTRLEAFTPLDSLFFKEVRTRFVLDFIYELSNRVNLISGYRLGLFSPAVGSSVFEHNLTASFWYYLENQIYLTISGDYIKQGNSPKIISTRVGLQYNLF